MSEGIVVRCKGACGQEVSSAEVNADGVCALCQIMWAITEDYAEYKRLWSKHLRYGQKGIPHQATEAQLGRVVGRIAAQCHKKLPVHGAVRLVNEICENARAEIEGYSRVLTVRQALSKDKKPKKEAPGERKTASGIYLAGR